MRLPLSALVLAALTLSACESPPPGSTAPTREDRWLAAVDGLCGALTSAQDLAAARDAFYDRSHDALHEIAAEVEAVDREAAAGLLEAKNLVERDFDTGATSSQLEKDLHTLIGETVGALEALGVASPGCA